MHVAKYIKALGLALVAVFAFGVVAAASASASEWLFEGRPITEKKAVDSEGTLKLTDNKTSVGVSTVECNGKNEGFVGPGDEDEVTKITSLTNGLLIKCKTVTGPCIEGTAEAMAVNLPWKTLLFLEGTSLRDLVGPGTGGEPGWELKCNTILGEAKDKCTGMTSVGVTNLATPGDVDIEFDAISRTGKNRATCSLGGAESGEVEGKILIKSLEGPITAD